MSGILAGYRLHQMGFDDYIIYEKGDSVGGTWRENSYPGLHCDVPAHHYCYSFALNPNWSKAFAPGPEIWAYFNRQAHELGVHDHIRFNSEVVDAKWDGAQWNTTQRDGSADSAGILISATGFLHQIAMPDIPGLETFAGHKFHTARWDHNVPLDDARIGIIGTGSTAAQIVSALAGHVRKLELFQRTPQWVLNVPQTEFSAEQREEFARKPEMMQALYDEAAHFTRETTRAVMGIDEEGRAALVRNCRENLERVKDPELRARLTPDYAPGCKRLIMSPDFYEAIQRPGTELVTAGIERIVERGVMTSDGVVHELDVLVLATGFDPTAYVRPMTMTGEGGRTLADLWAEQPVAYQCVTVPHMPNFFMIGGPYSPVGNISLVLMAEWQVDYIEKCITHIADNDVALSPDPAVTARYIADIRAAARKTIWATGGCQSWYLDAEGVPAIYPYPSEAFRDETLGGPDFSRFEVRALRKLEPA